MTELQYLQRQLADAEERLLIADTAAERWQAGNRCDQLEAAIADLLSAQD